MRARRPQARLAMLSTAWTRTDPFYTAWESAGQWIRLKATVDEDPALFSAAFLEEEKANLGEECFKREYYGIPSGGQVSPFTWEMYQRAMQGREDSVILQVPKPVIIAHDVGRSQDYSTAVIGGRSPLKPELTGIGELEEMPLGLSVSARIDRLAAIDQRYGCKTIIIADLSSNEAYADL